MKTAAKNFLRASFPAWVIAFHISACQNGEEAPVYGPDPQHPLPSDNCPGIAPELRGEYNELYANWHKWNNREPGVYSFSFSQTCECPAWNGSVINVVSDTVASTEPPGSGGAAWPADQAPTMDSLFFTVSVALCRNPDSLAVDYDPEYGFPGKLYVDYEAMAIDDEYQADAKDFNAARDTSGD